MGDYLKSISSNQLEYLIKKSIDQYLGEEFIYIIKDLNTPNANTEGDKITFNVEIREKEAEYNH
jgi:hypothetical protein